MPKDEVWRRSFSFHTDIDQIEENEWGFIIESTVTSSIDNTEFPITYEFSIMEWDEMLYVFSRTEFNGFKYSWQPLMVLPADIKVEALLNAIYANHKYRW